MKICPRLLIFELSDSTLRIFRKYDFSDFWIDIWGFLTQTFKPVCLAMECPARNTITVQSFIGTAFMVLDILGGP